MGALPIKTKVIFSGCIPSIPNRMAQNSNTTKKKVTVTIPMVSYLRRTTDVVMDYKFFKKAFPGMMTEKEFNRWAEDVDGVWVDYEWNQPDEFWEVDEMPDETKDWKRVGAGLWNTNRNLRENLNTDVEALRKKMEKEEREEVDV